MNSNKLIKLNKLFKSTGAVVVITLLFSSVVISGESLKVESIEVYSPTALPSIGLPVKDVPYAVQTATAEEISEQPGVSVADYMVNNLEGVTVNEVGGNPYQLEINYRGYNGTPLVGNPQGLSIYVDGVRQNMPFSNNVLWDTIPDFAIEDMQLVGGSNPVYGLNTLGGSLSMQTKSGRTFDRSAIEGQTGSWGRNIGLIETGGISDDQRFDYYVGYEYFNEDGWRDEAPTTVNQWFSKFGFEGDTTRYDLSYTGAHNSLIGNGLVPKYLIGNDLKGVHTLMDKTNNDYNQIQLNGTEFIGDTLMASGNIYWRNVDQSTYNGDLNDEYDGVANTNEGVINRSKTTQNAYGLNGQLTFDDDWLTRRNQLIVGIGYEYSKVKFDQSEQEIATLDPSGYFSGATEAREQTTGLTGQTNTWSGFISNNHALTDKWSVNTAARYNYVTIDNKDTFNAEGASASLTGEHDFDRLNPSVGLTYNPNNNLSTYASYNEANRAPTSIELGCANPANPCTLPTQMADDPPLDQVVAKTFEIGARGQFSGVFNSKVTWSISAYDATNHDDILFVYTEANTTAGYFTNVDETTRQGVDVGFNTAFEDFSIGMNYNYVAARYGTDLTLISEPNSSADDGAISVEDGDYLPNIPKHSFKVRARYQPEATWYLGATLTAFSSSYMMGNENQENDSSVNGLQSEVPGYAIINLDSEYNFSKSFEGLRVFAKVTNLLDNKYYTGGRLAETRVQADRSFGAATDTASLIGGSPRAAWVGVRYEF